jgi:L-seryl-tRNA(Ser) seleniumtransferase
MGATTATGIYDELGVKTLINAWGPMTIIGGSRMRPEVLAAMVEAGQAFVDIVELQRKAGQRIADLAGVEACYIAGGCAAGLAIATTACVVGTDRAKMARLPDTTGLPKNEVVIQRTHRNTYDHAFRQVGIRFVEIGNGRQAFDWELEAAIGPNTAAVAYVYTRWTMDLPLSLADTVRIAHAKNVPVIVDAAAETPPFGNLCGLSDTGADFVVFSGGKGIMGPQNTGLVFTRKEWIEPLIVNASPFHNLGRSMKVGKEEMAGVVRAVELYVDLDHAAMARRWEQQVATVLQTLEGLAGICVSRDEAQYSKEIPVAKVVVDAKIVGRSAAEVAAALANGNPGIRVAQSKNWLSVNPQFLEPGEETVVAKRLKEELGG